MPEAFLDEVGDREISAEIERYRPAAHFETDLPDLPLTRLSDRAFEVLAYELAKAEINKGTSRYTRATLLCPGADDGRDVLLLHGTVVRGVIQCKRYEARLSLDVILRELMRFSLLSLRKPHLVPAADGFNYQLWSAGELTRNAVEFFDDPQTYIRENHMTLVDACKRARTGVVALLGGNAKQNDDENDAATARVGKFLIQTMRPFDIKSCLAEQPAVRLRFFRGPNDERQRASAGDISRLMRQVRHEQNGAMAIPGDFVQREGLTQRFELFMASPSRLFVVLGASGQGKSRWARHVAEHPPAATTVDIIRGEDIHSLDQHVIDTLTRMLTGRRLGPLTSVDLKQAVFDWMDNASRLLIVDGLDRSLATGLHDWLSRSLSLSGRSSIRFVITSRHAAWSLLAPDVSIAPAANGSGKRSAQDAIATVELGPLSDEETGRIYAAHGLAVPKSNARPFRTPGLIAMEARLHGEPIRDVGTRAAVLAANLQELQRRLQLDAGIGPQTFESLIERLGDLLVVSGNGHVDPSAFRKTAGSLIPALDAAISSGLARSERGVIRVEPDDIAEFIMALRLDPQSARHLAERMGGDMAIGAASLTVARLESQGDEMVRSAFVILLRGARFDSAPFEAACRAVQELKSPHLVREFTASLIDSWDQPNSFLSSSPIIRMLDGVDLPAVERLELVLKLASGEDDWDWRSKYFGGDGTLSLRRITGFSEAAERAINGDPEGAIHFLLERFDAATRSGRPLGRSASVESGLLYIAIAAVPHYAALVAWQVRKAMPWFFERVIHAEPKAAADLFASISPDAEETEEVVRRIWSLVADPAAYIRNESDLRRSLASAASGLMHKLEDPEQIAWMLVAQLRWRRDPVLEGHLGILWRQVDDEAFWLAMEVRSSRRPELLLERLNHGDQAERADQILRDMPGGLFEISEWPDLVAVLDAAASWGLDGSASLALETLLYKGAAFGAIEPLIPLANKFASSDRAEVRRPMIFFTAGKAGADAQSVLEARETLLGLLVEHEDGRTLGALVWKLVQTATIFSRRCVVFQSCVIVMALPRSTGSYWNIGSWNVTQWLH